MSDLEMQFNELIRKAESGDLETMKRVIMIYTQMMENARKVGDFEAALEFKSKGEYWLDKANSASAACDNTNPVTLEEALPALKTQISPLEEVVFSMNVDDIPLKARDEFKEAIRHRCNFTNEIIDFIKDLQLKYPENNELNMYFNRYSDCFRQLQKMYNKL